MSLIGEEFKSCYIASKNECMILSFKSSRSTRLSLNTSLEDKKSIATTLLTSQFSSFSYKHRQRQHTTLAHSSAIELRDTFPLNVMGRISKYKTTATTERNIKTGICEDSHIISS